MKAILSINDLTSITSYLVIAPTSVVSTYAHASRPRPQDLGFSIRNEVRFQNEMSYKNENFIWNENRNEPIPEWLNVREKNSSGYHVNIRKEIYGDGMDSFRNESHDFGFILLARTMQ